MLLAVQQQNGSSEGWQRDGISCSCLENDGTKEPSREVDAKGHHLEPPQQLSKQGEGMFYKDSDGNREACGLAAFHIQGENRLRQPRLSE
ncbi:Apical Junction Component 1-like [Manis pentadactyla]|nr:Apical Junction Component 1-like [Manis pentadactyla]